MKQMSNYLESPQDSSFNEQGVSEMLSGIILTEANDDFTIVYINPSYYQLTGYSAAEHFTLFGNSGVAVLSQCGAESTVRSVKEQIAGQRFFSIKTQLRHKTRGVIWVHFIGSQHIDADGNPKIYIVVIDISAHIGDTNSGENRVSFNSSISKLTQDYFCELDLETRCAYFSKNFAARLGIAEVVQNYPQALIDQGLIQAGQTCDSLLCNFQTTDEIYEDETQYTLSDGTVLWYAGYYRIITDNVGKPCRLIGKMVDITKHKTKIEELSLKAEQDQLTGLNNKATTEFLIKETLRLRLIQDEKCALMIIDVDNFKDINDKFGHLYGDVTLAELADKLKKIFRSDDILGRIGGDEFFVFLKNYYSINVLSSKANDVCELFQKTYDEHGVTVPISASIGIALYPDHGTSFTELYTCADLALYSQKEKGKNGFTVFSGQKKVNYVSNRTEIDAHGGIQKSFKDNRIEFVFKLLHENPKPISAIRSVLKLVTEHFNYSRGYIFETTADGNHISNTFEWCAVGITPEIENLQYIPQVAVERTIDNLKKDGMFVMRNLAQMTPEEQAIVEPQGILSMLHVAIRINKKFCGFIGFDDCKKERMPTPYEIDKIASVCNVLGTFLMEFRTLEMLRKHDVAMNALMQNLRSDIMVVDRSTYELLYENHPLQLRRKRSVSNNLCYKVYMKNKTPCSNCPMLNLSPDVPECQSKLFNRRLGVEVTATAVMFDWHGNKNACLINCHAVPEEEKNVC